MVKLRLKRMGSKYNPFYRIVAVDVRAPRDGRFIEEIGYYNPRSKEVKVNKELKDKWLSHGAVPTKVVKYLFTKVEKLGINSNETGFLPKKLKKVKTKIELEKEIINDKKVTKKDQSQTSESITN